MKLNLIAIHSLLRETFTPDELRRLCQYDARLTRVIDRFGPGQGLDDMIDELVEFCLRRKLLDDLLAAVKHARPRQFALYSASLSNPRLGWPMETGRIAFSSNRDGHYQIYVMNADGSNQTRLTDNSADDWDPAWSP